MCDTPLAPEKKKRLFMRAMVTFTNNLLLEHDNKPEVAVMQLQALCDKLCAGKKIHLCSHCAMLIGDKRCGGCLKRGVETYYCSRECQEEAWPAHRLTCCKTKTGKGK